MLIPISVILSHLLCFRHVIERGWSQIINKVNTQNTFMCRFRGDHRNIASFYNRSSKDSQVVITWLFFKVVIMKRISNCTKSDSNDFAYLATSSCFGYERLYKPLQEYPEIDYNIRRKEIRRKEKSDSIDALAVAKPFAIVYILISALIVFNVVLSIHSLMLYIGLRSA